jgi:MiaB/RimO family radical SAM methylthiotransferase
VGVLGCMAERLKHKLLESDRMCDLVVGPDAYRDLPNLLTKVESGEQAINVILSQDETYADIAPVRPANNQVSAYVSIMRGCNNMCSYCIVPFTRGRERSRDLPSIVREVRQLSEEGYKEIVLLGQNVNSYNDLTTPSEKEAQLASGFRNIVSVPKGGARFDELLEAVSDVDPEMRIRFTSPHPKDFPDRVLELIRDRPNICRSLHMPAQSGSSQVLDSMRRGYTREAYLELVHRAKEIIPGVTLSSDFISGFCGETEEDHLQTLSLLKEVQYDMAFMFAYSLREKTHAHRALQDDVHPDVKQRRLKEIIDLFYELAVQKSDTELHARHVVLIEKDARRGDGDLIGRTDTNKKVILPKIAIPASLNVPGESMIPQPGEYVAVEIVKTGFTLHGKPLARTTLREFDSFSFD